MLGYIHIQMKVDMKFWMQSEGVVILEVQLKKVTPGQKPVGKPKPEEKPNRTSGETEAKKEQEQSQSVSQEEGTDSTSKEQ